MAETLRLYLDENVPLTIASGLRRHGIDVITVRDADRLGNADEAHLIFALHAQRIFVTHDDDFISIAASGFQHAGIAYCHQERYSIGELIQILLALCSVMTMDEMKNHFEFL